MEPPPLPGTARRHRAGTDYESPTEVLYLRLPIPFVEMISRGRTAPAPSVVVVAVAVATAATLGLMIVVDAQTIRPGCLPADPGSHDLWCPGDNNYTCYKIPSLLRIPPSAANDSDVLLAFIEGRKCVLRCQQCPSRPLGHHGPPHSCQPPSLSLGLSRALAHAPGRDRLG